MASRANGTRHGARQVAAGTLLAATVVSAAVANLVVLSARRDAPPEMQASAWSGSLPAPTGPTTTLPPPRS
jgi:hypothetical protein